MHTHTHTLAHAGRLSRLYHRWGWNYTDYAITNEKKNSIIHLLPIRVTQYVVQSTLILIKTEAHMPIHMYVCMYVCMCVRVYTISGRKQRNKQLHFEARHGAARSSVVEVLCEILFSQQIVYLPTNRMYVCNIIKLLYVHACSYNPLYCHICTT